MRGTAVPESRLLFRMGLHQPLSPILFGLAIKSAGLLSHRRHRFVDTLIGPAGPAAAGSPSIVIAMSICWTVFVRMVWFG